MTNKENYKESNNIISDDSNFRGFFELYQKRKQIIKEHCPSIEIDFITSSDYISESLEERSYMTTEKETFALLVIDGDKEYYLDGKFTEEAAMKAAQSKRFKKCKVLGFTNKRTNSLENSVRVFKD